MTAPLRTIVVPLDGSELAEGALPLAGALARASGATLQLVHVFVPFGPRTDVPGAVVASPDLEQQLQEGMLTYLADVAERVRRDTGGPVECRPLRARPIRSPFAETGAIVEALRRHVLGAGVDLIVMATHGRGGVSRTWLGSVVDALVRRVVGPVLLVRPRDDVAVPARPFEHILVPLDGSARSEHVLPTVATLAALGDARVTLLHVILPQLAIARPAPRTRVDAAHLARRQEETARYLEEARERFSATIPRLETAVAVAEHPARAIVQWAEEHDADLVALATHGRGGVQRFMLGSVADKVLRSTRGPVLITRPIAAEAESARRPRARRKGGARS